MRKEKIETIEKIAISLWVPGGKISFFLKPEYQAATLEDIHILPKPFYIPHTIIKEGKIDYQKLQTLGKDEHWLKEKIEMNNVKIPEILLATLDGKDQLKLFLYKD